MLKDLATAMRPAQWLKNTVIFAALIFSQNLGDPGLTLNSLLAFAIFCLLSSAVYLINDIADKESDRAHPLKRKRPIAAGRLRPGAAALTASMLAAGSLAGAWALAPAFGAVAAGYLALMVGYSLYVKKVVVADVFAIAAGFVLRAAGGAEAIGVPISDWLLVCVVMLALFLAVAKRRQEMLYLDDAARPVLGQYSGKLLDQMIAVSASGAAICYSLYTLCPETVARLGTSDLKYTVLFVLFGIYRYLFLVYQRREGEKPERVLLADPWMLGDILAYGVLVWYLIYR